MSETRDRLINMFSKIMAGTVTREEGAMLINHEIREDKDGTLRELSSLVDTPPPNVYQKTVLHTIALARNKAFFPMMVSALDHKNEEVSIFAANELASFRTDEAKDVIVEHLNSDAYHVRKASANALAQVFGREGVDILKGHIMKHPEPFFRATSAHGLLEAGKAGMEALVELLSSGRHEAVSAAAEAIASAGGSIEEGDQKKVLDALLEAGDRNDTQSILWLMKAVGAFGSKARSFEGYIRAFRDHASDKVRDEVRATLLRIGASPD